MAIFVIFKVEDFMDIMKHFQFSIYPENTAPINLTNISNEPGQCVEHDNFYIDPWTFVSIGFIICLIINLFTKVELFLRGGE